MPRTGHQVCVLGYRERVTVKKNRYAEVDAALIKMLRVLAVTAQFARQPETIGVFRDWALKTHEHVLKGEKCESGCLYHGSAEDWHKTLTITCLAVTRMIDES